MKQIMRKNQVIITVLAVMIAIAGYLTYAGKVEVGNKSKEAAVEQDKEAIAGYDSYIAQAVINDEEESKQTADITKEVKQGEEPKIVEEDETLQGNQTVLTDIESLDYDIEDPGEAVLANGLTISDYMAQTKLAREQSRGRNKEDLLSIIDSDVNGDVDKQAAIDAVVRLTDYSDKENAVETMLGAKGFEHSIVSITQNAVDVVICKDNLTDIELAQIEDIVKRKASVSASQICITLMGSAKTAE